MKRRTFIKGAGAAGATAAVGVGATGSVSAQLITPIGTYGLAKGVDYVMTEGADLFLGDSRDYSGYTGSTALHQEIEAGALRMKSADEKVFTSISNNIQNSANVALTKGKAAIIEQMNAGNSESAATTAMQNAIDGYYSTIQKNILTHLGSQLKQIKHQIDQVVNHSNLNLGDVYTGYSNPGSTTVDIDLLDGSTQSLFLLTYTANGNPYRAPGIFFESDSKFGDLGINHGLTTSNTLPSNNGAVTIQVEKESNSEVVKLYLERTTDSTDYFWTTWSNLINERDNVNSNLSGFVSDIYAAYKPGDIPTEDLVDPITASTELRQNYQGYQAQGAHAAMLGIPTSAAQSVNMSIQFPDGEKTVTADIFTNHVPTDANGNEIGFESAASYDPSNWSEPLYIAYEYTTDDGTVTSDFTQIKEEFTINSITNTDTGEALTSFKPSSQNNQTADVQKLQEELAQVRKENIRLQEEAQETTSGGGAGAGFFGDTNQTTLLALGGAVLALVFGLGASN